ncbi:MAG: hypothetical protein BWY92_01947 [Firmicutes bacterium ADurb.BinA052]|nr:MAG: hypothetical protein BWY92_01947 [Firmicutes bacterium ADurb.BinA052]
MYIRRVTVYYMCVFFTAPLGAFDNQIGDVRLLETGGYRVTDASAADDDDRVARHFTYLIKGVNLVVAVERLLGAGKDQHAGASNECVRSREDKLSPFPDADHGQAESFPDAALRQRLADQRCADGRSLRQNQILIATDDISFAVSGDCPGRKRPPQHLVKLQDTRAACQFENSHRMW